MITKPEVKVACQDVNDLAIVLASSLGGAFHWTCKDDIETKLVKAIGDEQWSETNFEMHYFIQKSLNPNKSKVWDATMLLVSDDGTSNPPDVDKQILPLNLEIDIYKTFLLKTGTDWKTPTNIFHRQGRVSTVE